MPLKLMYITNMPQVAALAQDAGVDRIFIDLETVGKQERQGHLNSVKSHHAVEDICRVRSVLHSAELLVRINPIYAGSRDEIDAVIDNGADIIMLPMWKSLSEVDVFLNQVNDRAKCMLLLETKEAVGILDDVLRLKGIDEIHIGLNDLHISYNKIFMFELLCDGTVERICKKIQEAGHIFGFGGVGRIGFGEVPAEYILAEHYRLGSKMVILSRSFCDISTEKDLCVIKSRFFDGVKDIRMRENECKMWTYNQFADNQKAISVCVRRAIGEMTRISV